MSFALAYTSPVNCFKYIFANRQIKQLRFLDSSYPKLRLKAFSKGFVFV